VRDLRQTLRDATQQQSGDVTITSRSRHDQIGFLVVCDLSDHVRRASRYPFRQLEFRIETFLSASMGQWQSFTTLALCRT
jgi:hypothetical protein